LDKLNLENVYITDVMDNEMQWPVELTHLSREIKQQRLIASLRITKRRAQGDYRVGVPQFFRGAPALRQITNSDGGELQILLPISMGENGQSGPHLAVAICRCEQSGESEYIVKNILTLEQAFSNARLIGRIDQKWLNLLLS
jgi:hypothetical protein